MVLFVSSLHSERTKSVFQGNSSVVTTKQATVKTFLRMTPDAVRIQTPVITEIKAYQQAEFQGTTKCFLFYSSTAKQCYDSFQRLKLTSYGGLRHFKSGICQCWICFVDQTLTYCCVAHTHWGATWQVMLNQSKRLSNTSTGSLKKTCLCHSIQTKEHRSWSDRHSASFIHCYIVTLKTFTHKCVFSCLSNVYLTWTILSCICSVFVTTEGFLHLTSEWDVCALTINRIKHTQGELDLLGPKYWGAVAV